MLALQHTHTHTHSICKTLIYLPFIQAEHSSPQGLNLDVIYSSVLHKYSGLSLDNLFTTENSHDASGFSSDFVENYACARVTSNDGV